MSIRLRLVAIIVLVALVPLGVSAWTTLGVHRRALDDKVQALQARTGEQAASSADQVFSAAVETVARMAVTVPWRELSAAELEAVPWLIFRQVEDIAAVVLLDAAGQPLGSGAALAATDPVDDLARHPRWPPGAGLELVRAVETGWTGGDSTWVGAAVHVAGAAEAVIPVAVRIPDGGSVRAVVVAVALRSTCAAVGATATPVLDALLVDGGGRILCGDGPPLGPAVMRARHVRTRTPASHGWVVLIDQDIDAARAPSRQIRLHILYWLGVGFLAAVAAGLLLARRIVAPVEALARGAAELGGGNVAFRLPEATGRDEIARLSRAFNQMGDEVQRRDAALQSWNERLQQSVDDRTRELADAQEQLLRSQRIAAVGSLGAGFAHEINNPLTGLLGMTQVLLERASTDPARARDARLLASMEQEALRIKEVVSTLRRFTDEFGTDDGLAPINLGQLVDETIALVERRAQDHAVALERRDGGALPPVLGDAKELQQALLHLVDNALQAMDGHGRIEVATSVVDEFLVQISVSDTGSGIAPEHLSRIFDPFFTTKQNWRAPGLGLTTAFRIVERHHGKIKVHSTVDEGTTMTILLPAARRQAHLA